MLADPTVNTTVSCLGFRFSSPLIGSAGCVGYGTDFFELQHKHGYAAAVLKTITLEPRVGNPSPRVCETEYGLLNSIGLQNPGIDGFVEKYYPALVGKNDWLKIGSVAGFSEEEYVELVKRMNQLEAIDLIELNLSCPNVHANGNDLFACNPRWLKDVVSACVAVKKKPLIVKLSPNVSSIGEMAKIVEDCGGDAVTIANTFWGMKINPNTRRPMTHNGIAGYSGPAIKPIVLALVYQASKKIKIPIVALGGVMKGADVVEYLLAGASLVGVGTANFIDLKSSARIYKGLVKYLKKHQTNVEELIGGVVAN